MQVNLVQAMQIIVKLWWRNSSYICALAVHTLHPELLCLGASFVQIYYSYYTYICSYVLYTTYEIHFCANPRPVRSHGS